jgi:hypothetical protein
VSPQFWLGFIAGAAFVVACCSAVLLATVVFFARLDRNIDAQRTD